jgi:hypothetical protein
MSGAVATPMEKKQVDSSEGTPEMKPFSPIEFVKRLASEDKEDILALLIRELISINGEQGMIPLATPDGESLGYFVPPAAAQARSDRIWSEIPSGVRAKLSHTVNDPANSISSEEMLAILSREGASTVQSQ